MRGKLIASVAACALSGSANIPEHVIKPPRVSSSAKAEYRLLKLDGSDVSWQVRAEVELAPVISYAFVQEPMNFTAARNCGAMRPPTHALARSRITEAAFRDEVKAAFAMWAHVAAIEFRETEDPHQAGILIGAQSEPRGRAFTNVATEQQGSTVISKSLICLNPEKPWKIGFDGNLDVYDLRYTMAHEIGHAIGLDHPGRDGQLMSYRYVERSRDLTPGDIAGAVAIYGPRDAPDLAHRGLTTREARLVGDGATSRGLAEPEPD